MDERTLGPASTDEMLIDAARKGRIEAFNQLVLRYQGLAHNVAYRLLGESQSAADATQDSFLKAYQRLHQYRKDGGAFRSWLMRIVVNTCYDALRIRRRHWARVMEIDREADCGDEHPGLRDGHESPEDYVLRQELAARIEAAIGRLPLDQRTVLILSDIEGFEYHDIAVITGIPLGTVKSRLARARARLRDALQASNPHPPAPQEAPARRPARQQAAGSGEMPRFVELGA